MKDALQVGTVATTSFEVTKAMWPSFDGRVVHEVCSTWDLVRYMEAAARAMLEPHLLEGEEGIGSRVEVDHCAPAPTGARIDVTATATRVTHDMLVCEIEARHAETVVARGEQTQRVLPRTVIDDIMHRANTRSGDE